MKNTKYTPGPWRAEGFGIWSSVGSENRRVACTEYDEGEGPYKVKTEAEAIANACLIAAAPELLEACKNAVGAYDALRDGMIAQRLPGCFDCLHDLKAAIAKAEGSQTVSR